MDDFTVLKVLGKGNFGKVVMARKIDSGHLYAIKILSKAHISQRGGLAVWLVY
jgi:serine/threonine protein kinase